MSSTARPPTASWETTSSAWTTTSRGAISTSRPARASAYARRPSILIAEVAGGTCEIDPTSLSQAAASAEASGSGPSPGSSTPSGSPVSERIPSWTTAR